MKDEKHVVPGPASRSDSRNEVWGNMFGIKKDQKITDEKVATVVQAYNPDGLTLEEYLSPNTCDKKDIGRPQVIKEKRQMFKGSAWITETAPVSLVDELIPILDILCNFNDIPWFESLRQMLKLIPKGFPIRLDIPLFYVLTARVTFQSINEPTADSKCTKG